MFRCNPRNGGCDSLFSAYEEATAGDRYVQCPVCGRFIENLFFDESKEVKEKSYLG